MAKKLKLEEHLRIIAINQFTEDFVTEEEVLEMDADEQVNREFVGEFLYNEGVPTKELKMRDCIIVKMMTTIYCDAYNDCLKILKR